MRFLKLILVFVPIIVFLYQIHFLRILIGKSLITFINLWGLDSLKWKMLSIRSFSMFVGFKKPEMPQGIKQGKTSILYLPGVQLKMVLKSMVVIFGLI